MNNNYIPATIKCFWCNGKMTIGGPTHMGSGLNNISYFCCNCGGIAHFACYDDRNIKTFTVNYNTSEKANKNTSNEKTIGHWLDGSDNLPPIGGFHD